MSEYQYGWNSKMASKSNMAAIMKCQLIHENMLSSHDGNIREIAPMSTDATSRSHDENKGFTTFQAQ